MVNLFTIHILKSNNEFNIINTNNLWNNNINQIITIIITYFIIKYICLFKIQNNTNIIF